MTEVDRAKLAYDTFRGGIKGASKVPEWENTPGWVRDAVLVAYLQGKLDAPRPFHGAECMNWPNCSGGCGLGCTKEIERSRAALLRS